jgi:tellurite methyltransferase
MSEAGAKWDALYARQTPDFQACTVLSQHSALLPQQGWALDLACGWGGNALLLAEHGLNTQAWDCSEIALQALAAEAERRRLCIETQRVDIAPQRLPENRYALICVSRFLDRGLCERIVAALQPQGLLFYQTFIRHKPDTLGPRNPEYLLEPGELLRLFQALTPVVYQEYANTGTRPHVLRNEALLVAQKSD